MPLDGQARAGVHPIRRALTGERLFAALFVGVGILAFVEGLGYGFIRSDGIIGPGFIPIIAGLLLTAMGVGIIVQTFTGGESLGVLGELERDVGIDTDATLTGTEGNERSALLVFIGCGLALVLSNWFGLILSLSLLVFAILLIVERQPWWKSLIIAAAMGAGAWVIFVHFLEVPLGFGIFAPS
jgi:putative tricarboxylic transport membrane protein